MNKKAVWYLAGGLMAGALVLLAVSCGGGAPAEQPAPTVPTTPTTPAAPEKEVTPTPPATPAAVTPPKIPHTLEGRSDCLVCHKEGVASAPKFPASLDHSTFTGATCSGCHTGAVGPKVPDNHAGRSTDTCVSCHKDGITNAPKIPASPDHSSFTKDACRTCHPPS